MNRRKSREVAMKLLYEVMINKEEFQSLFENYDNFFVEDITEIDKEYVERVFKGVQENSAILDEKIESNLLNWKLNRISKVNLTILRIAIYEILFEESIPDKVSVNEAIELAKVFSEDKSPKFINGVLGNFLKED